MGKSCWSKAAVVGLHAESTINVMFECWCSRAVELCRSRASMWWITKRNRAAAWGSQKYVRDMQCNWSDKGVHQGSESLWTDVCRWHWSSGEVEVSSGEKRNENQKQDGIHVSEWEEDRFKYLGVRQDECQVISDTKMKCLRTVVRLAMMHGLKAGGAKNVQISSC